jgi:hypothetical protein
MKKYHPMFLIVIPNSKRHQEKKNRWSKPDPETPSTRLSCQETLFERSNSEEETENRV